VPATALVLFIVVASVVPQLEPARDSVLRAVPVYVFAVLAPMLGWLVGRLFRLPPERGRAIAFSAATRNTLVVVPFALAVPDALPILPAVVVTQSLVELVSELIYVRLLPGLGERASQIEPRATVRKHDRRSRGWSRSVARQLGDVLAERQRRLEAVGPFGHKHRQSGTRGEATPLHLALLRRCH
jgi:predicted permease